MDNQWFMGLALEEAKKAALIDEVPIGAVLVDEKGEIVSKAHNLKESNSDPLGHAEIIAIHEASKKLESWRLSSLRLFVTLEPCMMCAGAIWQSRLKEVIYGASDLKAGFITSIHEPFSAQSPLNHKPKITGGILAQDCGLLLTNFFKQKRKNGKAKTST